MTTGRRVSVDDHPWIDQLVGDVDLIGTSFFDRLAEREGLMLVRQGDARGVVPDAMSLEGAKCSIDSLSPAVVDFYERTSDYKFDVWSEWSPPYRTLGRLLAALFSRRLQQLNVPLSSLDTRLGISSEIIQLRSPDGTLARTAWVREVISSGRTLYSACYSACVIPDYPSPCLRVVFPLPNGNAHVILSPTSNSDGSLTLSSRGRRFGDPGFYFFVRTGSGEGFARYVASLKEEIHVYAATEEEVRADHVLELWGKTFLRLHYRMRSSSAASEALRSPSGN